MVLQANRYFSKNVRGKAASAVREMAVQVHGRMVDDSKDQSTTFESLATGEVLSPAGICKIALRLHHRAYSKT